MSTKSDSLKGKLTENFSEFSQLSDYSFINSLKADPQSTKDGNDHKPRSVYSGPYVPVVPTAIPEQQLEQPVHNGLNILTAAYDHFHLVLIEDLL